MKLYKNEIEVAEREDMGYTVMQNTWSYGKENGRYFAEVHFYPKNRRWETFGVGSEKGYKTESGTMNAIKKHAERYGYTLVMA